MRAPKVRKKNRDRQEKGPCRHLEHMYLRGGPEKKPERLSGRKHEGGGKKTKREIYVAVRRREVIVYLGKRTSGNKDLLDHVSEKKLGTRHPQGNASTRIGKG